MEENNALHEANQRLEEESVVCVKEREEMGRELAQTKEALEGLELEVSELRSEVNELKNKKEELDSKQEEMQVSRSLFWQCN